MRLNRDSEPRGLGRHSVPIPREHGAWVLVSASLLSPLVVVMRRTLEWIGQLPEYGLLVAIALGVLFFREAFRRWWGSASRGREALTPVVAGEALFLLLVSSGLLLLAGAEWAIASLVLPAAISDIAVRRRGGWPFPMGNEVAGVLSLSLAIPAGAVLLGLDTEWTIVLWGLYLCFQVGGLLRVRTALRQGGQAARDAAITGVGYHLLLAIGSVIGWHLEILGPGAVVAFGIALGYTLWRASFEASPARKSLGQAEAVLSTVFVLAAPWFVG
ncbi:MAG: YwiC-like family protein [Halodesulfurarchaeum sp.]